MINTLYKFTHKDCQHKNKALALASCVKRGVEICVECGKAFIHKTQIPVFGHLKAKERKHKYRLVEYKEQT
jgi:hypothetical protein